LGFDSGSTRIADFASSRVTWVNSITRWIELSSSLGAIFGEDGSFELGDEPVDADPPRNPAKRELPAPNLEYYVRAYQALRSFYTIKRHQSSNYAPL
jgi:hypothetical protein